MNLGTIILLALPAACGLTGTMLLVWGRKGKRLDTHPICRRCGFDLIGLPLGVRICSECGANLNRRYATQFGNRRKRPWPVFIGALLLLVSFLWFGGIGWIAWRGTNVNQHKPAWWLALELEYASHAMMSSALAELCDRMDKSKLGATDVNVIAARLLARQAQQAKPWHTQWGLFVEHAQRRGRLTGNNWETYLSQALETALVLRVREEVRRGDPQPIELLVGPARVGAKVPVDCARSILIDDDAPGSMYVNPIRIDLDPSLVSIQSIEQHEVPAMSVEALPGDMHRVRVLIDPVRAMRVPLAFSTPVQLQAQWALVDPDRATVELIDDDSLRDAVERTFAAVLLTQRRHMLFIEIGLDNPPMTLGYRTRIRAGEREFDGPSFLARQGTRSWVLEYVDVGPQRLKRANLIFEPSTEIAARTPDITRIWNGRIERRDLEVR